MHNERCTSGSEGGPEKPIGRKADRALRSDPTAAREEPESGIEMTRDGRSRAPPCEQVSIPNAATVWTEQAAAQATVLIGAYLAHLTPLSVMTN